MSTPISIVIPHKLGRAAARARIADGFDRLKLQLAGARFAAFQQAWSDDRLSFSAQALGQSISGRIDVDDAQVRIEIDLPAFLAGVADKIAGRLRREGQLLLKKPDPP